MKLVDANVLLNAINSSAPQHDEARTWLDRALSGSDVVAFAWQPLLAFIRIASHPTLMPAPLTGAEATDIVAQWTSHPGTQILHPTARHGDILRRLLDASSPAGNLVNDAHIASLAIEHRATVVTYDADFQRFPEVRWQLPS
ncbi:type II toxin-antitoxin system VapC family toxin [Microbacterium karelineae]|uniref:type II toxin-antitoxin system VapC family toxin n=1 Tax=Microbacterium karelineae TaxID=2654283 RepID=UPI0012EA7D01|nr:type II toxin-antitoxin system VapC family toxin [Microbacterium karelineae]